MRLEFFTCHAECIIFFPPLVYASNHVYGIFLKNKYELSHTMTVLLVSAKRGVKKNADDIIRA